MVFGRFRRDTRDPIERAKDVQRQELRKEAASVRAQLKALAKERRENARSARVIKAARSGASEFSMAAATEISRIGKTAPVRRLTRQRAGTGRVAGRTRVVFVGPGGRVVPRRKRRGGRRVSEQDIAGRAGGSLV